MNNILNNLISKLTNNSNTNEHQNTYPSFSNVNNQNNNIINSLLPMLLSGNGLPDLSSLSNSNPMLKSILSLSQNKNPVKKIESDKIDVSSLSKV